MGQSLCRKGEGKNESRFKTITAKILGMAKNKKKGGNDNKGVVEVLTPASRSFFKNLKPPREVQDIEMPEVQMFSSDKVINSIKFLGKGWDKETEKLLAVPDAVFFFDGGRSRHFSESREFGDEVLLESISSRRLYLPESEYVIVLYETSSTVYFVLADARRRIVVREQLQCLHDDPPEKDWGIIKEEIKEALKLAGSDRAKKEGFFAVYDGDLRLVRAEKAPEIKPSVPAPAVEEK